MRAEAASPRYLAARWLLPVSGEPVENACVVIEADRITAVVRLEQCGGAPVEDFGNSVITPGLFNLHTHFDYTDLRHFATLSPFFDWIDRLVTLSRQWTQAQFQRSAFRGASELALSGTTFAADATFSGAAATALAKVGLRGIVGLELFGIVEEKAESIWRSWLAKYDEFMSTADDTLKEAVASGRLQITVAPHTPFTVCPSLLGMANAWACQNDRLVLLHVSESDMECQWIASSFEQLDNFLSKTYGESLATVRALNWHGQGRTPVEHLEHHGLLIANMLAAHTVKLTDSDIALLGKAKLGTAHCPRSNSRLRNGIAPFSKLTAAGINVGFGTDSAASSDDLDVLSEARFAWNLHRAADPAFNLSAADALYHLTLGSAKAVGLDSQLGSLAPGKLADLSIFSLANLPETAAARPCDALIYGGAVPTDVFVGGCQIVASGKLTGLRG